MKALDVPPPGEVDVLRLVNCTCPGFRSCAIKGRVCKHAGALLLCCCRTGIKQHAMKFYDQSRALPSAAPVTSAPKTQRQQRSKLRMVKDYRYLNNVTAAETGEARPEGSPDFPDVNPLATQDGEPRSVTDPAPSAALRVVPTDWDERFA